MQELNDATLHKHGADEVEGRSLLSERPKASRDFSMNKKTFSKKYNGIRPAKLSHLNCPGLSESGSHT